VNSKNGTIDYNRGDVRVVIGADDTAQPGGQ